MKLQREFKGKYLLQFLGVMNAADYYGLEELKRACSGFIQCCVTVDTVCALLATAERYIQYKCTKYLVQKVIFPKLRVRPNQGFW